MQLTGDLSDFALTDILQILALSRKTGMVLLEGAEWAGKIVVENGRITEASVQPGESLADSLFKDRPRIIAFPEPRRNFGRRPADIPAMPVFEFFCPLIARLRASPAPA
jgi:hypothetical protein